MELPLQILSRKNRILIQNVKVLVAKPCNLSLIFRNIVKGDIQFWSPHTYYVILTYTYRIKIHMHTHSINHLIKQLINIYKNLISTKKMDSPSISLGLYNVIVNTRIFFVLWKSKGQFKSESLSLLHYCLLLTSRTIIPRSPFWLASWVM